MEQIKDIEDDEQLPENKEYLMEFYTKAMFKLLKNIALLNTTKKDSTIIRDFEKTIDNLFDSNEQKANEFINVKENLLPQLQTSSVVKQNNAFVSRHIDFNPISTFNNNLKAGDINPLTRNTLKRILNINTKFRNNYTTTHSTNFIFDLPSTVKKVVRMKLVDSNFPEMVYTVSDKLGSNSFTIDTDPHFPGAPFTITIPNGSYSSDGIVDAINLELSTMAAPMNTTLSYDENTGRMTFAHNSPPIKIIIDFSYTANNCPQLPSNIYKDQLTLGWLLGFRGDYILPIESTRRKRFPCNLEKDQRNILFKYEGASKYIGESYLLLTELIIF